MFEYLVVPCKGDRNVAKAVEELTQKGYEPIICTYTGAEPNPRDPNRLIDCFLMIFRRPDQGIEA